MSSKKTGIILVVFFILLTTGFMFYYFHEFKNAPRRLATWGNPGHRVDTFTFISQEGKPFSTKDLAGKIYVAEYFFTTCKGICPKMNESLEKVYKAYRGNRKVLFLSHTVDPKKDTVAAMKAYSRRFDADPKQWIFLTGAKQRLYDMARYSYLINAKDDTAGLSIDKDFIHDNHLVLVDKNGYLRGRPYDALQPAQIDSLIDDIRVLLEEKD